MCISVEAAQSRAHLHRSGRFLWFVGFPTSDIWLSRTEKEGLPPNKGLPEFLEWIDGQGFKKAAVTNAPR